MPSFAELKAKAAGVTTSGVEKFQNVRDKNSSVPMKKTNWDPYSGQAAPPPPPPQSIVNRKTKPVLEPLPPPPSRTSSAATSSISRQNSSSPAPPLPSRGPGSSPAPQLPSRNKGPAPPPPPPRSSASKPPPAALSRPIEIGAPPPISRLTRPGARVTPVAPTNDDETVIDWANLTPEDKQVFFSWLDEFFANFKPPTPGGAGSSGKIRDTGAIDHNIAPPSHAPPPLRSTTKPTSWNRPQAGTSSSVPNRADFVLSHPPASEHGSAALDMAYYFAPTTHWTEMWFNPSTGAPVPPPLVGDTNHTYTSSWVSRGTNKTTNVGVIFSDLSVFWGSVQFTTTSYDPNQNTRDAAYLGRPQPLGQEALVEAHEIYGDTIALFAESFLGSGQYCARGECWDLANEALKYFKDYDYIPKPVPSISRTHGHLIYESKSSQGGREMTGRWRGGDDRVRRGDIVEWRRVRIGIKGANPGSFYTLGDPDHTAIIVSESIPSQTPKDGGYLSPVDLGVIVVVEQSLGHPPKRTEYHMSCLQEGEMWIYRPISMLAYLGVAELTAVPSDGVHGLHVQRL